MTPYIRILKTKKILYRVQIYKVNYDYDEYELL